MWDGLDKNIIRIPKNIDEGPRNLPRWVPLYPTRLPSRPFNLQLSTRDSPNPPNPPFHMRIIKGLMWAPQRWVDGFYWRGSIINKERAKTEKDIFVSVTESEGCRCKYML